MDNIYQKKIHYLYEANIDNYDTLINSDVYTNYGVYKSGNKTAINNIAYLLYNYIINNFNINSNNINDWILVIPSVIKNTSVKLASIIVNQIKYLLDNFYSHNFKICCTYIENNENVYNYSKINNFEERNKLLIKNNIKFSENIDLSSKKILLIDDSFVYGVTIQNTIKVLEKLNLNLNNLLILVYIKANKELLKNHSDFENTLNYQWYYNKFNVEFNTVDFCKYFINNKDDHLLTLKVMIIFLKLNEEEIHNIKNLLIDNNSFYKEFLNECILFNLDIKNSVYYNRYLLYNEIYNANIK
jgi:hypoxanthine phosphoribosyltransferase